MRPRPRLLAMLALFAIVLPSLAMTPQERKTYLDKLVQTLPAVPSFNAWLERTHELPPDFDALPKINGLPDPLRFVNGRVVGFGASGSGAPASRIAPSRPAPSTSIPSTQAPWPASC